jgi:hypothetical protein
MSKDIFILAKQMAGRQNPIVSALLYEFCPAAAHWYVRGAEPAEVLDVVWKAFEDYATGKSLRQCLDGYGLSTLVPDVRTYMDKVRAIRSQYSRDGASPEVTHYMEEPFGSRFGLQNQLNALGGTLGDLKHYVRVWHVLMRDWKSNIKMSAKTSDERIFQLFSVSLSVPGMTSAARVSFPVWGWDVRTGVARMVYLGLLVLNRRQPMIRFSLVQNSDCVGDKPWPHHGKPMVFGLDRDMGYADAISVNVEQALKLVPRWYEEARVGRSRPIGLDDTEHCRFCGYKALCYGKAGESHRVPRNQEILDAALEQLTNGAVRERQFSTRKRNQAGEASHE